jgi:carboxymethylenebutenolidase
MAGMHDVVETAVAIRTADGTSEGFLYTPGADGHLPGGALRMATAQPDAVALVASFHGRGLYSDTPSSPHLVLPQVKARLHFAHAVQDRSLPQEAIDHLNEALQAWGGVYDSEVREGACHSWTVADSPVDNEAQADRAFHRLTSLLAETLPSPRRS